MASIWLLQFPFQHSIWGLKRPSNGKLLLLHHHKHTLCQRLNWISLTPNRTLSLRAVNDSMSSDEDNRAQSEVFDMEKPTPVVDSEQPLALFRESVTSSSPVVFLMKICQKNNFAIGLCIAIAFIVIALRAYAERKSRQSHPGSVADLVRRGQLRSDRRGISAPLKYDDPFNNPLVKVGKSNLTVEMCGKQYRLAPVTLTKEEQAVHQKRRSRAYQWKRPTIFLKEGDSVPPDVEPDTIRWIPANHPFATTVSDIDEDLAQNNVYQKRGVPFRIQAEHDALQKKLEALQKEEKLNNLFIDSRNAKDFQRPYKLNDRLDEPVEQSPINSNPRVEASDSIESNLSSEETQKP